MLYLTLPYPALSYHLAVRVRNILAEKESRPSKKAGWDHMVTTTIILIYVVSI